MRYVSEHSGQSSIFFVFLYFTMPCYVLKHSGQNSIFFVFSLFCYAMLQNITGITLHIQLTLTLTHFLTLIPNPNPNPNPNYNPNPNPYPNPNPNSNPKTVGCVGYSGVMPHKGQNFIFFVFLYFDMLCYVSKHRPKFHILCFSLFWYAMRYVHTFQNIAVIFFLCFSLLCFGAMFWNIAKISTPKSCGVSSG